MNSPFYCIAAFVKIECNFETVSIWFVDLNKDLWKLYATEEKKKIFFPAIQTKMIIFNFCVSDRCFCRNASLNRTIVHLRLKRCLESQL